MRLIISLLAMLLLAATPSSAPAVKMSHSRQSLTALTKTFGFLIGQQATLSRIETSFPDLATQVEYARSTFRAALPNAQKKIENELLSAFGPDGFRELRSSLDAKIAEHVMTQKLNQELAISFVKEVAGRSKGLELDSDIWKTLLAANYFESPVNEFLDGHKKRYSFDGSGKSLGARYSLSIPLSWPETEAVRPNVVTKWVSENGNGTNTVMIQVWSMQGEKMTFADAKQLATPKAIKSIIPELGELVSSKSFVHEGKPAVSLEYRMDVERIGIERNMRAQTYAIFSDDVAIHLTCMTVATEAPTQEVDSKFLPIKPLCLQIANSLTLLN